MVDSAYGVSLDRRHWTVVVMTRMGILRWDVGGNEGSVVGYVSVFKWTAVGGCWNGMMMEMERNSSEIGLRVLLGRLACPFR